MEHTVIDNNKILFTRNEDAVRLTPCAANAIRCNIVAFLISNTVCYVLNRLFVFEPGLHGILMEAFLFFAVSAASTFVGTTFQTLLIKKANMQTTFAFSANLVASLAINFVMRKFVVFKG